MKNYREVYDRERADAERRRQKGGEIRLRLLETRALCCRAERAAAHAQAERFLRESRALREAAERRLAAPTSDQGQLVAAVRRGLSG